VDAGARWQALADDWTAMGGAGHYAFNDVHALLAQLGAGRLRDAEETLASMERHLASGGSNAVVTREVGLPLGRALLDFARGRYRACTEGLLAIRSIAHRFGGSHAQRDVVHLTLVEAALRSGQGALARALVAERLDLKPASPFNRLLASRAREAEAGAV
jgi:hypothetical protein